MKRITQLIDNCDSFMDEFENKLINDHPVLFAVLWTFVIVIFCSFVAFAWIATS